MSIIAQIFDPLGLFLPVTVRLRWFFQEVNKTILEWDTAVSKEQTLKFHDLLTDIRRIGEYELDRFLCKREETKMTLHIFSDASTLAHGDCAYVQLRDESFSLINARVRICSKGDVSIPRLELAAALTGVKLYLNLKSLNDMFATAEVLFWVDSMTVLRWVQGVKQWAPFIENRVSVIRKAKLVDKFRYINTFSNPADLLTRGLTFEKLSTSKLWWNGPDINYLSLEVDEDCDSILNPTAIEFMNVHVSHITPNILVDTGRFSSLKKLTKVLYFVMKFVKNCRKENFEYEYNSLLHALIQQEQRTYFPNELKLINSNKRVSTFKTLKLCIHNNLIVVQTRFLDHPELSRHLI